MRENHDMVGKLSGENKKNKGPEKMHFSSEGIKYKNPSIMP